LHIGQAGHYWGQLKQFQPLLPCPIASDWGWSAGANGWQPLWTTVQKLPPAAENLWNGYARKNAVEITPE